VWALTALLVASCGAQTTRAGSIAPELSPAAPDTPLDITTTAGRLVPVPPPAGTDVTVPLDTPQLPDTGAPPPSLGPLVVTPRDPAEAERSLASRDGEIVLDAEFLGIALHDPAVPRSAGGPAAAPDLQTHLRRIVTLRDGADGDATGGGAATAPPRAGDGHSLLYVLLEPLAMDLLEQTLDSVGEVDGTAVFSVLGRGAFVLEMSRDGSGIALHELYSNNSVTFGNPASNGYVGDDSGWQRHGPGGPGISKNPSDEYYGEKDGFHYLFSALARIFRAVEWALDAPLAVAIPLLTLLLAGITVSAIRNSARG